MMRTRPIGWLEIEIYWDFFDFPRYILARDADGCYWIFEGSFDDDLDEYQDHFIMKCVGGDLDDALKQFKERIAIPLGADRSQYESVALKEVKFDESLRRRVRIDCV